jgi:hypothetical protein
MHPIDVKRNEVLVRLASLMLCELQPDEARLNSGFEGHRKKTSQKDSLLRRWQDLIDAKYGQSHDSGYFDFMDWMPTPIQQQFVVSVEMPVYT